MMTRELTIDHLKEFLGENYEKFVANFNPRYLDAYREDGYTDMTTDALVAWHIHNLHPFRWISSAFFFMETTEGTEFWLAINEGWRKHFYGFEKSQVSWNGKE
ncbi:MAG: hypothetical protein LBP56_00215 [Odoribacteraceae bacterium]|jgi:hypothetical protein|nr:hypothetical protein [Odoribacteraceae bacterium]